ncbi:MAG: hypothetical protein JSV89_14365 [Spirochaetaceae bacterium]|nr:MAG: hypothetical protein JSV89_14365 [Spirochaetaceae bacterium]
MKKTLILVLVLAFIPLLCFAEFGLGPSAFFNSPVLIGQSVDGSTLREEGFTFGADARLILLRFLQLEALGLVTLGEVNSIDLYADAGLALDLAILRLSAGVGPNFSILLGNASESSLIGFNAKANADIKLGRLSFGLSYIMGLTVDGGVALDKSTGMLGANLLFWF